MSGVVRLGGFLVLLAVLFLTAFAAGKGVGPVTPTHGGSGGSGSGMHMSSVVTVGVRQ